jgi:hypothetical protein
MRKAMIASDILVSIALAFLFAGCAAMPLPAPKAEGDCLVIIKTRVENPGRIQVVRNYSFGLSTGGAEKLMPTSPSSYMAFVIDRGSAYISNRHTNITAEGWTGGAQDTPMWFPLPYKAGYAVIADAEFVHRIEVVGDKGAFVSHFDIRKGLSAEARAALLEELKAREGVDAWKLDE